LKLVGAVFQNGSQCHVQTPLSLLQMYQVGISLAQPFKLKSGEPSHRQCHQRKRSFLYRSGAKPKQIATLRLSRC